MQKRNKYAQLFKDFPKLYKEENLPFGIECSEGWYHLIRGISQCIQDYIDSNQHLKIEQVEVTQIKEKFGGLRFYIAGGDKNIFGMIWFAEYYSFFICELCGKPGKLYEERWHCTRCEKHKPGGSK